MKLEKLCVYGTRPSPWVKAEITGAGVYQMALDTIADYQRLYVRMDEIPDILVEARAFMLGAVNHEDASFGWDVWEFEDREDIPNIRRFLERLGYDDLASEVRGVETDLAQCDPADVAAFFSRQPMPQKKHDEILKIVGDRFSGSKFTARFGANIWDDVAKDGADMIAKSNCYKYYPSSEDLHAARRQVVESLSGYDTREQQETIWRNDLCFHRLLVNVGERYYRDEPLKTTRHDGSISLAAAAAAYEGMDAFDEATRVYELSSTKRKWLCCLIGNTSWLVDPETGEKVTSVEIQT